MKIYNNLLQHNGVFFNFPLSPIHIHGHVGPKNCNRKNNRQIYTSPLGPDTPGGPSVPVYVFIQRPPHNCLGTVIGVKGSIKAFKMSYSSLETGCHLRKNAHNHLLTTSSDAQKLRPPSCRLVWRANQEFGNGNTSGKMLSRPP